MKRAIIEAKTGGRCYTQEQMDGTDCPWGSVLVWDPPARLVIAWQITPRMAVRARPGEVQRSRDPPFAPPNPMVQRAIQLEHRHFERHRSRRRGDEGGVWISPKMDRGGLLALCALRSRSRERRDEDSTLYRVASLLLVLFATGRYDRVPRDRRSASFSWCRSSFSCAAPYADLYSLRSDARSSGWCQQNCCQEAFSCAEICSAYRHSAPKIEKLARAYSPLILVFRLAPVAIGLAPPSM